MSLGTNIAIMDHGLIQQCDTPKNIYNKPESVFVADFIGSPSMNLIEGKLKKHDNNIIFMPNGSNNNIKIPVGNYSFKNKLENIIKNNKRFSEQVRLKNNNGEYFWFETNATLVFDVELMVFSLDTSQNGPDFSGGQIPESLLVQEIHQIS